MMRLSEIMKGSSLCGASEMIDNGDYIDYFLYVDNFDGFDYSCSFFLDESEQVHDEVIITITQPVYRRAPTRHQDEEFKECELIRVPKTIRERVAAIREAVQQELLLRMKGKLKGSIEYESVRAT